MWKNLKRKGHSLILPLVATILGSISGLIFSYPILGFVNQENSDQYYSLAIEAIDKICLSIGTKTKNTTYQIDNMHIQKEDLELCMLNFLNKFKKRHLSEEYINIVHQSFIDLIEEDGSNVKEVLYFMALCSVESNFDQYVPTKSGAGITQVIYRIHKKYITELGVSKENFYKSSKHNIYVGYHIFCCYWRKSNKDYFKASERYNGNATKGYSKKVQSRFNLISKEIKQRVKSVGLPPK